MLKTEAIFGTRVEIRTGDGSNKVERDRASGASGFAGLDTAIEIGGSIWSEMENGHKVNSDRKTTHNVGLYLRTYLI